MIWIREVNLSVLKFVKEQMKNLPSDFLGTKKVNIFFRKPNELLRTEDYPSIVINFTGISEGNQFKDFNSFERVDIGDNKVKLVPKANIFLFNYQLDFWGNTPMDVDSIYTHWVANTPPSFMLDVLGTDENIYPCNVQVKGFKVFNDTTNGLNQTLFRYSTFLTIRVRLYNEQNKEAIIVDNVNLNKEEV